MDKLDLLATLWPSFPHFQRFAHDGRLAGIRLNSAMMSKSELLEELAIIRATGPGMPLFFDIKARQLRVEEVHPNPDFLEITLNHSISVETPTVVLFKAGQDPAVLGELKDQGRRLLFSANPNFKVKEGESLHIRHLSLVVHGPIFTAKELVKIGMVKEAGFTKYFLSYVEAQGDVDEFLELVGKDSEVWLKIESKQGLRYAAEQFKPQPNLALVAARGDMYVEVNEPHDILQATKLIIEKDPHACVGSRLLLSLVKSEVPECSDFSELAWLYDIGYRRMMLCDELCLKEALLVSAVDAFERFRGAYTKRE